MTKSRGPRASNARRERAGSVRIIAGEWRGRRLPVVGGEQLRPTPDRVRETLFNWLMPVLPGARCLDLYAGTGVLGFEALSRGAAEVWFVERDAPTAAAIEAALRRFGGEGRVVRADARRWLETPPPAAFDVVFLDPPYGAVVLEDLCTLLSRGWIGTPAWIYLETGRDEHWPALPGSWTWHRQSEAGGVRFALAHATESPAPQ